MILDTNAVSALFAGDRDLAKHLSGSARHHLPLVVSGEYRFGLAASRRRKELESLLSTLERESHLLALDVKTTEHYAAVRRELKAAGTPIPENDIWIAALARRFDLPVVSRDRHFDLVDGVKRIHW